MESEVPKRMLRPGSEPLVSQKNNSCRMSILSRLEEILPREYNEVKQNPVFGKIIAIHDNGLSYSARMIHSLLCRQLMTDKIYELWFLFENRTLRFSLQKFYAVTGLRYAANDEFDFDVWEEDDGFWSKFLKRDEKLSLNMIWKDHIVHANKWRRVDRVKLVYVCIIAGVILARGEKAIIPNQYIKVVMDVGKLRAYPWGVKAFDLLLESVQKTRDNFFIVRDKTRPRPKSYVLDGLSYALQVWGMEAIPLLGNMLGEKLDASYTNGARCANWSGAVKVLYEEIIHLENTFGTEDILYPFISWTGNVDVIDSIEYQLWADEMFDGKVNQLKRLIRQEVDWTSHIWEVEESLDTSLDVDEHEEVEVNSDDMEVQSEKGDGSCASNAKKRPTRFPHHGAEKRKLKLLCDRSASKQPSTATQAPNFEEMKNFLQNLLQDLFAKMEEHLEKKIDDSMGKLENKIIELKNSVKKISERSLGEKPPVVENVKAHQRSVVENSVSDNLYDVHLSQSSKKDFRLGTQEYLQKALNGLSQDSFISGFDPTQPSKTEEPIDWWTPINSIRSERVVTTSQSKTALEELKLSDFLSDADDNPDSLLTFVPRDEWNKFCDWAATPSPLSIGPTTFDMTLAKRIMGPKHWLGNEDMDAVMFLFRENISLRRWDPDRVSFMPCLFNIQINAAYNKYLSDKKKFTLDSFLIAYGTGELPSHGRTNKVWGLDVDRLYIPLFVNQNHWISMCINIFERKIEVFYCEDLSLVDDEMIRMCRPKIEFDLWNAANDPILVQRILLYTPPVFKTAELVEIDE